MSIYDPAVIVKYGPVIEAWLAGLPTDSKKQNILHYLRGGERLEDFVRKMREGKSLPEQTSLNLMDIVSPTWNREKVIAQYEFVQMMKKIVLEGAVPVSDKGIPHPLIMEARNRYGEIKETLEKFEDRLLEAIHAYNRQMIVQLWYKFQTDMQISSALHHLGINTDRREMVEEIRMLDSHYYMEGNSRFRRCADLYEKLEKHETGKLFLLSVKEIHKAAAARKGCKVEA